ncbi:MAG TPA: DUF883 family protein [Steroidobacteraceae bacterium]|nr:DUF883 family protein [Steroidobacteraceae bacterium]
METTAGEFSRGGARLRGAAQEAAQEAGGAAREEVQNLISDVEDLIDRVGEAADPEVRRLRSKVAAAVETTKQSISDSADQIQRQAREAFSAGDRYVRNQPWEAIGIAALAGIAVGYLVSRR